MWSSQEPLEVRAFIQLGLPDTANKHRQSVISDLLFFWNSNITDSLYFIVILKMEKEYFRWSLWNHPAVPKVDLCSWAHWSWGWWEERPKDPWSRTLRTSGEPTGNVRLWYCGNFQNFLDVHSKFFKPDHSLIWMAFPYSYWPGWWGCFLQRAMLTNPCPLNLASTSSNWGLQLWKQKILIRSQIIRRVGKNDLHNNFHRFQHLLKYQACLREDFHVLKL